MASSKEPHANPDLSLHHTNTGNAPYPHVFFQYSILNLPYRLSLQSIKRMIPLPSRTLRASDMEAFMKSEQPEICLEKMRVFDYHPIHHLPSNAR
jgi:hypothetical protein